MKLETDDLTLRPVTDDDIEKVARMWDFGNGEIFGHPLLYDT